MPTSPVTQKQIAQRLGISRQVVSSALGGSGRVGEEMRRLVLREADEMGYRTNKAARALVTKQYHQVALWMHSLTAPFAVHVHENVRAALNESGFDLVARCGHDANSLNSLLDGMLVLSSPSLPETASLEWAQGVPIVMMGVLPHSSLQECDTVGVTVRDACESAVRHLQQAGCRRVAFLATPNLMREDEPRCGAYRTVMRESGQPIEEIITPHILPIRTDAQHTMMKHVQAFGAPDGLICGNDDTALGAIRAFHDLRLHVPNDVKVIGFDGTFDAADSNPPLSTIALPIEAMCRAAWKSLQQRLEEPSLPLRHGILDAHLICRESSR